jgi:hypothetical protein
LAQAFAQEDDSQQHAEGLMKTEAGLDDEVRVDAPYIDQPVDGEQDRRNGIRSDSGAVEGRALKSAPLPREGQEERQQDEGPGDAVADDLDGADGVDLLPVDGENAPEHVGGDAVQNAFAHVSPFELVRPPGLVSGRWIV